MSKRTLDQIIGDLNSFSQNIEAPRVDTKKLAKDYYEKKLREQKGNYRNIVIFTILSLTIFFITAKDIYSQVSMSALFVYLFIAFILNLRADKKMKSINKGMNFVDYQNSKKETTRILLEQFKMMRFFFYPAALIPFGAVIVEYYHTQDWLSVLITVPFMIFGFWFGMGALNSGIKEFKETLKD